MSNLEPLILGLSPHVVFDGDTPGNAIPCFVFIHSPMGVVQNSIRFCPNSNRFKELTKDMAEARDPTMGVKPDEKLAERLTKQTATALQTDISSIEDEYDD